MLRDKVFAINQSIEKIKAVKIPKNSEFKSALQIDPAFKNYYNEILKQLEDLLESYKCCCSSMTDKVDKGIFSRIENDYFFGNIKIHYCPFCGNKYD